MAEPAAPHHRLEVDRHLGAFQLRAELTLESPWTLIFGPSGSGKSSLLRAAGGLLGTAGVLFSRFDTNGAEVPLLARGYAVPACKLGLGYAPQQGALFPHLTVEENVAFSRTVRGGKRSGKEISDLLDLFEIHGLRTRLPRLLSGGERQRVNLARAFAVPDAHLLLLDEPFSGIGRELRDRLLARMQAWTAERGIPVLSVSHDVDEALLLKAEVVVLEDGQVVRRGPAKEALAAERKRLQDFLQE